MTDDVASTNPELDDNEEAVVQQISQLWYNNFGDVEDEGDELDPEQAEELFREMAQVLNEHDIEDLDKRQELVLEGIREAMQMLAEKVVSQVEDQLSMYRHLLGI